VPVIEPVSYDPACPPDSLQPLAATGALAAGEIACLERSLDAVTDSRDRDRVSRLLIANEQGRGDDVSWRERVHNHLYNIDGSNPALAFQYALSLFESGAGLSEAGQWAEVALANRNAWAGEGYNERTYAVYKLRAAISQSQWQAAETAYAAGPGEDSEALTIAMRSRTGELARQWQQFADGEGMDSVAAKSLCDIAGGGC
jgi:hypothetical protein